MSDLSERNLDIRLTFEALERVIQLLRERDDWITGRRNWKIFSALYDLDGSSKKKRELATEHDLSPKRINQIGDRCLKEIGRYLVCALVEYRQKHSAWNPYHD